MLPARASVCTGGRVCGVTEVSADYNVDFDDGIVSVDTSGGPVTLTLLTALVRRGRMYRIKDLGAGAANNVTIATEGAETIDGAATKKINTNFGCVCIFSDGTNWFTG
jgi:hypothetical protein